MGWFSHVEKLIKFLQEVRALVSNTERNQNEIKDLQGELQDVGELLKELMFEVKRMQDRSFSERKLDELLMKNFRLQVELLIGKKLSDASEGEADKIKASALLTPPDSIGNDSEG